MTNLKTIMINMITLGILIFGIMSFIVIIQSDSNLDNEDRITNHTLINDSYVDLESSLSKEDESEESLDSLEEVPPQSTLGDLDIASIISTSRTVRSIIISLWNIYIKLPMVILGVDPMVAGAISTILLILIAIGIWAIWKGAIS